MQASSTQQVVHRRPVDPRRVFCTMCEHSEFVHGDYEARRCLYSECGCSGFTLALARRGPRRLGAVTTKAAYCTMIHGPNGTRADNHYLKRERL